MKKTYTSLFIVIITLFTLVGCSANSEYVGEWEASITQDIDVGISQSVTAVATFNLDIKEDETLVLQMSNNDQEVFDEIVAALPAVKQEEMEAYEMTEEEFDAMFLEENGMTYEDYVEEYRVLLLTQMEQNLENLQPINGTWTVENSVIQIYLDNSEMFGIPQGEALMLTLEDEMLKSGDGVDFTKK